VCRFNLYHKSHHKAKQKEKKKRKKRLNPERRGEKLHLQCGREGGKKKLEKFAEIHRNKEK